MVYVSGNSHADDDGKVKDGAKYALAVLTGINLLNYIDRYVPSAAKELIKEDLKMSDAETSAPLTAFIIVFMCASPVFSHLADNGYSRKKLICAGVVLWSLATAAGALAVGFWTLVLTRSFVGVGEAAYATIAPALLSDYYPAARRSRILSIFYLAIPVGAALGYAIGGKLGDAFGWRVAFLVCGIPGIALAFLILRINEPPLGATEKKEVVDTEAQATLTCNQKFKKFIRGYTDNLLRNKTYLFCTLGYVCVTFASGGMADWLPTYLHRYYDMDVDDANMLVGAVTVVAGIAGTMLGSFLGEAAKHRFHMRNPYLLVPAVSTSLSTLFGFGIIFLPSVVSVAATLFLCQIFLWCYTGPISAQTLNSVGPELRNRAMSLQILLIHALGDAVSPTTIGKVSDATGLRSAIVIVPIALGLGCLIWFIGYLTIQNPLDDDLLNSLLTPSASMTGEELSPMTGEELGRDKPLRSRRASLGDKECLLHDSATDAMVFMGEHESGLLDEGM